MSKTFADSIVIQIIIDMIKKIQVEDLVLLSSFYHPYLPMCKKLSPDIPTAALQAYKNYKNLINYLHTLQVDAYHPKSNIISQKIVTNLKEAGLFVNVFTVNKTKQKNKFFDWGVNSIFTDLLLYQVNTHK